MTPDHLHEMRSAPPPPREPLLTRFLRMRRGPWENLATIVIAAGVLMLLQPISITLYTYSFATLLFGTAMFMVVSKFPE